MKKFFFFLVLLLFSAYFAEVRGEEKAPDVSCGVLGPEKYYRVGDVIKFECFFKFNGDFWKIDPDAIPRRGDLWRSFFVRSFTLKNKSKGKEGYYILKYEVQSIAPVTEVRMVEFPPLPFLKSKIYEEEKGVKEYYSDKEAKLYSGLHLGTKTEFAMPPLKFTMTPTGKAGLAMQPFSPSRSASATPFYFFAGAALVFGSFAVWDLGGCAVLKFRARFRPSKRRTLLLKISEEIGEFLEEKHPRDAFSWIRSLTLEYIRLKHDKPFDKDLSREKIGIGKEESGIYDTLNKSYEESFSPSELKNLVELVKGYAGRELEEVRQ